VDSANYRLDEFQAHANIVGEAPAFRRAIGRLPAIARSEAAVMIAGESGTGKELIARAIHYLSQRAASAFVAINCGSFPESLLESELFGHERGAFTNAVGKRVGLIAHADGGTLFLDEVDSLPPKAQVNLLRVLQDKKFRALGSNSEQHSNVRFVAATNAAMGPLVRSGEFRTDLFYRLCVFTITLPPLRERREDILPLAEHFLRKHKPVHREIPELSEEARDSMLCYEWPGNVRELENAIIRGIHLSGGKSIGAEDVGLAASVGVRRCGQSYKAAKQEALAIFEKAYLGRLLFEHGGNITNAARAAEKDRRDFGKLVKKHRLDPKHYVGRREIA
jgi:two-component system, NtrC family, response regulator GlrR